MTALTSQVSQVKKDEENRLTAIQNIQTTSRELSQRTETQLAELLKVAILLKPNLRRLKKLFGKHKQGFTNWNRKVLSTHPSKRISNGFRLNAINFPPS